MITLHTLGFPRIGAERELKFGLERYWRGEINKTELEQLGQTLRAQNWALQREAGLGWVTVGDFAYYDHVAQHIQWLGCEPARFHPPHAASPSAQDDLDQHFLMARGTTRVDDEQSCKQAHAGKTSPLEMTKWFDTNYHYLVPEFDSDTQFTLNADSLFVQVAEAHALEHRVKVVLIGPLSFLWLGKEKSSSFDRLTLIDKLVPI